MPRCGIVILAAGGSTRMGRPKQLLKFEGQTLLQRAVAAALGSVCRPVVVVLGSGAGELKAQVEGLSVFVVVNEQWAAGMGTSIRAGIAAMGAAKGEVDAAVILLCDQPLVTSQRLDQLVAAHFQGRKPITAAFYSGIEGTPAVFGAALFKELATLEDNQGGKALFGRHAVERFPLAEAAVDVDTAADFARLSGK